MSDTDMTLPPDSASEGSVVPAGAPEASTTAQALPSWQEQDVLLRTLWIQNKTPQEISNVLGRSIAAIMTRAARLGLPRRAAPGRKPGSRVLASGSGIRPPAARTASRVQESSRKDTQATPRVCLMCLRTFPSMGRHNRICNSCKNSAEYESAVSLADINLPI